MNDLTLCVVNDGARYPGLIRMARMAKLEPRRNAYYVRSICDAITEQARVHRNTFGDTFTAAEIMLGCVELLADLTIYLEENDAP